MFIEFELLNLYCNTLGKVVLSVKFQANNHNGGFMKNRCIAINCCVFVFNIASCR